MIRQYWQSLSYEEIKQRLFPSIKERAQGIERLPIRRLKANASPFVCANLKVLSRERAQKYGIDLDVAAANLQKLKAVAPAVQTIFAELLQNGALMMLQRQVRILINLFILDLRAVEIKRDLFRSAA